MAYFLISSNAYASFHRQQVKTNDYIQSEKTLQRMEEKFAYL